MGKGLLLVALAALLAAGPALADAPAAPSPFETAITWFKHLREGLANSAVRGQFQARQVTAVAAVRGERQSSVDPDQPAWRLSSSPRSVAEKKERAELSAAVDQIIAGKYAEGGASLDAFEKRHPKSKLLPAVAEARKNLAALQAKK